MSLVSFTPYERLTASSLNLALSDAVSQSATGTQQMASNLNLPSLNASVSVQTEQLIVTGDALFSSDSAIIMPVGSTFDRPPVPQFGMIRANSDSGLVEVMLASGLWATLVTTAAATSPQSPPVSMAGIQFGQASSTAIPMGWTNPSGGTPPFHFTVQYRLAGTSVWSTWIEDTTALSTTIGGLLPATRYEFQIAAFNAAGTAVSPVTATNTVGFLPGGPTNVTTSSPTSTTITVNWIGVTAPTPVAYIVEYAAQGATSWTQWNGPIMDTFATVDGLIPNTTFSFQVVALTVGSTLTSLSSVGVTTSAAITSPNAATGLIFSPNSITNSGFTISWNAPTAGTTPLAYYVQTQLTGTSAWVQYKYATTGTSMVVTGLDSGSGYNVRVEAVNSAGTSFSGVSAVTTLPAIPASNSVAGNDVSGASYPIVSGPAAVLVITGGAVPITGVTVLDPPAAYAAGTLALTVSSSLGTVTMTDVNGNQIAGSGTQKISYNGTLGAVQAALASLVYTAGSTAGSDNIAVLVADQLIQQSVLTIDTVIQALSGSPPPPPPPNSPPPGAVTATGQPTDPTGTRANRSGVFLLGLGICVRLEDPGYNQNFTLSQAAVLENMINYVSQGQFQYLREAVSTGSPSTPTFMAQIAQNTLMSYILSIDATQNGLTQASGAWQGILNDIESFAQQSPNFTGAFAGVIHADQVIPSDVASAAQFQATIYSTAHSLGLQAWQMTPFNLVNTSTYGSPPADVATVAVYPPFNPNGRWLAGTGVNIPAQGYLSTAISMARTATPNVPIAITELGWQSFPVGQSNNGLGLVDENVQATYILETVLSAYKMGVQYYFVSELLDVGVNLLLPQDTGMTYGLFRPSGQQKIAAAALSFMSQCLADDSVTFEAFTPGYLNYSIGNRPGTYGVFSNTGYQDVVFQKSTGEYWIAMWNEQPLNTVGGNNATIGVAPANITLTFNNGPKTTVNVYDPIAQAAVGPSQPLQTATSVTNMTISLPAHPILVQVIF